MRGTQQGSAPEQREPQDPLPASVGCAAHPPGAWPLPPRSSTGRRGAGNPPPPRPRQPQGPALQTLAPNFASVLGPNAEGIGAETPVPLKLGVPRSELRLVESDSPRVPTTASLTSARQAQRGGGAGNKRKINPGGTLRS